jgi:hypothetical protein
MVDTDRKLAVILAPQVLEDEFGEAAGVAEHDVVRWAAICSITCLAA